MENKILKDLEDLKEIDVLLKVANDKLLKIQVYGSDQNNFKFRINKRIHSSRKDINEMMGLL